MTVQPHLRPAAELAAASKARFPNESEEYRTARTALLVEEIELRRRIERVAAQRRALPLGGEVTGDYRFEGEDGPASFAELFAGKSTLIAYSWMFGPKRERACPMCTSMLDAWDGEAPHVGQRVSLAVIARSPIARLVAFRRERGWRNLRLYADVDGAYTRDYVSVEDADVPAFNVFSRREGTIRHFWSSEMGGSTADPGQDPRGAPDQAPLWTIFDTTPEGRGTDWYPKLEY